MTAGHRWRAVLQIALGPWPIRPLGSGIVLGLVATGAVGTAGALMGTRSGLSQQVAATVAGVGVGVLFGLLLRFAAGIRERLGGEPMARAGYLLVLLTTSVVGAGVFAVLWSAFGPDESVLTPAEVMLIGLRPLVVLLVLHAVFGLYQQRYTRQVARLENALEVVQQQQALIVEADERARYSVATFLHDEVQSALLALGMRIGRLADEPGPATPGELVAIAHEVEELRRIKVRAASRRLSPVLTMSGLPQALRELAAGWLPGMRVSVTVSPEAASTVQSLPGSDGNLAVYRITEQALMNAAQHGRASHVEVLLECDATHLHLSVVDDGTSASDRPGPAGAGSTIMDAWAAIVGGSWSREMAHPGTTVRATVPVPAATRAWATDMRS